jgi:non-heme chloroperoxidase
MRRLAGAGMLLCAIGCAPKGSPGSWHDPSPHTSRMVRVDSSTSLEVLDWGGHGQPIVLLAGLGNSAHVFDHFAPLLTDSFHVLGMTRRGFGASSQPPVAETGRLVEDIAAVLDTLGVRRVILIGHSIAGEELSAFGAQHPDRTSALVYLDAAYDRSGFVHVLQGTPIPPPPPMTSADSASPAAVAAYVDRTYGLTLPESEVRAITRFDSTGHYEGDVTPDSAAGVMMTHLQAPDYAHLRSPALAIFAASDSIQLLVPYYAALDSTGRQAVERFATIIAPFRIASVEGFRQAVLAGEVLEIHNANHYVFISNQAETVGAIRAFLARRVRAPR